MVLPHINIAIFIRALCSFVELVHTFGRSKSYCDSVFMSLVLSAVEISLGSHDRERNLVVTEIGNGHR